MHGQSCCFYETYSVLDISFAVAIIVVRSPLEVRGYGFPLVFTSITPSYFDKKKKKKKRKEKPKGPLSCAFSHLLIKYTQQFEILMAGQSLVTKSSDTGNPWTRTALHV